MEMPTITVESDYDSYFEGVVERWIEKKAARGDTFKHKQILITAGPWRPYAVMYRIEDTAIHLDFYSALRTGLGELSELEVEEIMELL